jgi:phosphinothricin acetyltransferase
MPELSIRPASAADITAITAIYRPAVLNGTASFEVEPPDEAEMLRRYQSIVGAGYPYLVAEAARAVVGYAYANAYRTRPAYRFTVEDSIYVAPDAHGQGIGTALLDNLIKVCTDKGFRLMLAVIGDSAQAGSIGLHRRAGFKLCGTLHSVGHKHGRWLDVVLMERPLGPGDTSAPVG